MKHELWPDCGNMKEVDFEDSNYLINKFLKKSEVVSSSIPLKVLIMLLLTFYWCITTWKL